MLIYSAKSKFLTVPTKLLQSDLAGSEEDVKL